MKQEQKMKKNISGNKKEQERKKRRIKNNANF